MSGSGRPDRALEYLDFDDLVWIARRLGVGPIRDAGLLGAAAARPRFSAFGDDAYPSVETKAAALLHSLARNHPLIDGNKRLAWAATAVFLHLNGYEPDLTDDLAFALVLDVAEGWADVDEIAARLCAAPRPRG